MVESTPLTNAGVEFWSTSDICNVETVGICMGLHIYCIESCTIMQKWSWCDEMYAAYSVANFNNFSATAAAKKFQDITICNGERFKTLKNVELVF